MKKGVNWIENQRENCYKMLKNCLIIKVDEILDQRLGPSISETKYDRDKPIFSVECEEINQIAMRQNSTDPIGSKISKMGVITAEPPYHAKVWEYPLPPPNQA